MVGKVLINNLEKYELSFFKVIMQLRAINYIEKNSTLDEKICKCAKIKIKENLHLVAELDVDFVVTVLQEEG